jgi:preprotein translocase subunit SecD
MRTRCLLIVMSLLVALTAMPGALRAQEGDVAKSDVRLVMQLEAADVTARWLTSLRDEVRNRLRDAKIGIGRLVVADGGAVQLRLAKPEETDTALKALADIAPGPPGGMLDYYLTQYLGRFFPAQSEITFTRGEAGEIALAPTPAAVERRLRDALADATEIARRRLEGLGIAATVTSEGRDRIALHAPAAPNSTGLKDVLTRPGGLAFHEVHPTLDPTRGRIDRLPQGYRIYSWEHGDMLLRETPAMRGSDLADAQPIFDQRTSEPVISFRFNANGTRAFAKFTADNVGKPFAIVLDDVVLAAPVIREPILGGSGQVSGNFTRADASNMAVRMRAGALPAKLVVVEEKISPAAR